ncbi:hypothetical protein L6452_36296 [Arctium lappa]|uniref:Uncharacterized protein n=1 Tax=Arctium lappa TaxID=4217 RepID=A0ACB8Y9A3_ARCLA|nr:hypothetical protein L6452_36296 [Arctium lappa]
MDMVASLPVVKLDRLHENALYLGCYTQVFATIGKEMNLRKHIVHGGVLPRKPMAGSITIRFPSLEELDIYDFQQWKCFLLHLINYTEVEVTTKSINPSMMKVFQRGLLSQRNNEGSRLTKSGFQFLLMDTNAQLW